MVAERIDARRLVFVDECGTNTSLSPLYAYSPKERAAGALFGAAQLGREHHAAFEHEHGRDGAIPGSRKQHHPRGV